ncbi:MAG TPA: T9SS type A sorting domain-containing protein [candidate division Zixibacteria bacterium]|nr:T9SS type A sorting domain-containing protein [candidate division Zixibacteria bacterium]
MPRLLYVIFIVGCLLLAAFSSVAAQNINKLLISPLQPASLDYGEHVTINFAYENNSGKAAFIVVEAYHNSRLPAGFEAADPLSCPNGSSGAGSIWFTINSGVCQVDEIRIYMVDKEDNILFEVGTTCQYYWPEHSLFNIGFDPGSGGYEEPGTRVDIDFDYFTSESGGIRVFVEPRLDGIPDGNAVVSPSSLYPVGAGTGSCWFEISTEQAEINSVYFYVTNNDQSDTLFEKTLSVNYHFVPNFYKTVFVNPQPTTLNIGEWVQVSFSYTCNWDNGALFALDCLEEGLPSDKDTVIGGFTVEEGIGYDTLWFTYTEPGHVQQLQIRMYDADSVEMACGFNIGVAYDFVNPINEVNSITLLTPSPATIDWDNKVHVAFTYNAFDPEGIKILVLPWLDGSISPYVSYSGTPIYPVGVGDGNQWFKAVDCGARVDEVHLRVMSTDNSVIYQDTGIAVDYDFTGSHFTLTELTPACPATVEMGDEVVVNFDFETMCNSSFRTWVMPMSGGNESPGAIVDPGLYAWTSTGSDSMAFSINNAADVTVDELRFQIRSIDSTELYDELYFPVEYYFTEPTDVEIARQEGLPEQFSLGQNYPNPFNPSTTIEYGIPRKTEVRIGVYNILGGLIRTLVSQSLIQGHYRVDWDGTDESGQAVSSGVYFYRIEAGDYTETRKMMLLK